VSDPRLMYESLCSGAPAPPVEPEDVKRVWQFIRTTQQKQANARGPREAGGSSAEGAVSIQDNLVAEHCSPGANASAVFFRCQMLALLMKQRLLAPWQHGEEIDDFLFQVFASYPLHVGNFDVEALLQHIRENGQG
jgi:hypothetical protein